MWSWLSVALSGFISISANESNQKSQAVVFKTLTLFMLVAIIWTQDGVVGISAWWITLGLIISALADSLYIFQKHKKLCFAAYIGSQLCYSTSFWLQLSGEIVWWLPAMLLAIGIVVFFLMPR